LDHLNLFIYGFLLLQYHKGCQRVLGNIGILFSRSFSLLAWNNVQRIQEYINNFTGKEIGVHSLFYGGQ